MKNLIYRILLFSLIYISYSAFGQSKDMIYYNNLNKCQLTKAESNSYEPANFQPTNNLLRKTGQVPRYEGKKIIIQGRVLDKNCVPVPDSKVYLWQVGNDSKYPYKPLRKYVDQHRINTKSTSTFTGSGTATTDSNGEFTFITIYPGKVSKKIPYVNVRVEHRALGQLQAKLYLTDNYLIDSKDDRVVNNNPDKGINDTSIYNFDIVLSEIGLNKY